ncbi:MAG: dihydropyrimidinase [Chloroflexi bacterium]|nr:dihydropyrimidinase [Chloroflexota bacterium]
MDTVIKGSTIVTAAETYQADVGIVGERIAAIGHDLRGENILDATGKYLIPGAIDPHVHMQLPVAGTVSSDDFATGTIAAACGGTTTIVDFVEAKGGQSLLEALAARRAEADDRVAIDYGLHMTLANDDKETLAEIPAVVDAGCTTFKLYMAYEGLRLRDEQLLRVLAALGQHGALPIVHAENHAAIAYLVERFRRQGHTEPRYHPLTRPALMEGEATGRVLALAALTATPLYIVHVSCKEALAVVERAQTRGQAAYGETCPQYLLLTADEYDRPDFEGAKFVMSPPPRSAADQEALWNALRYGVLQVVATDHCPFFFVGQKELGRHDFSRIPGGIPGVETRLALLYTFGVGAGRLSLQRWVEVCCTAPARIFGLAPQKGSIAIGADADLVIFDPQREVTLSYQTLHQHVDYCPYEGLRLRGYPDTVLSRGRVVVQKGEFVGQSGWGRFVARKRPVL